MNPFLLPDHSIVSFSGGRTSAMMLWLIVLAFGGKLPPGVRIVFCNTGKERPETLDFVRDCAAHFGVEIIWLEYRWEPGRHYFVQVDYATASRRGEPFELVIQARGFLPNPVMRFCTAELKIRTTNRYVRQALGWETYHNAIGLRADEPKRVEKMRRKRSIRIDATLLGEKKVLTRAPDLPPGETPLFPLYEAGLKVQDVMNFWAAQPFDLALRQDEGNCDLCFLKGANKLLRIMEDRPDLSAWWAEMETRVQHRDRPETERFRADRPKYADLLKMAQEPDAGPLFDDVDRLRGNGNPCEDMGECRCTD